MRISRAVVVLVLTLLAPTTAAAQWQGPRHAAADAVLGQLPAPLAADPQSPPALGRRAALGAALGFLGGGALGIYLEVNHFDNPAWEDSGIHGLVIGSAVGAALVTPLIVHHANERSGSLGWSYAAAGAIAATGPWLTITLGNADLDLLAVAALLSTPVAIALTSLAIERASANAQQAPFAASVSPRIFLGRSVGNRTVRIGIAI
jgi:hypothetical protein